MPKPSRRDLLKCLGAMGTLVAIVPSLAEGVQLRPADSASELGTVVVPLEGGWQFRLDPEDEGESRKWQLAASDSAGWVEVTVPHTWQVSAESADYQGVAWYRRAFEVPSSWAGKMVRLEFEAVNHSATVWLNDKLLGKHLRKGYTAFSFDVSSALRPGHSNFLAVRVDNSFDPMMLPRGKSYDWTVDGGIIRPANLLLTPHTYIERVDVDAQPEVSTNQAPLTIQVALRNATENSVEVKIGYKIVEDDTGRTVFQEQGVATARLEPATAERVLLPVSVLGKPRWWHFDHPNLYRVVVEIEQEGKLLHTYTATFGVRRFEVRDGSFYLNGEPVRLMGVERMAGSHPDFGMAEPASWILHDHYDLKELNCVFSRVHWPQDKRVLDYCDRHGILIQEEAPAWGPDTFQGMADEPAPEILENGIEQLREMISRDRNHPSIFAWGLCNEVNGQNPPAQKFVRRLAEEARKLDPTRLLTYASNSLQQTPERDVAGLLDFISWNEYYETWYGGSPEVMRRNLEEIHRVFPDQPVVISEYGYCECKPEFSQGDTRRIELLREHTRIYRDSGDVSGAIFFCYNDYRTHIGDKGTGVLRQRVHGVVDLYGERKPSFEALRQESSPIEELRLHFASGTLTATVTTRKTLPAYTLAGYSLRWIVYGYGDLPMEQHAVLLPKLSPGQQAVRPVRFTETKPRRVRVDVMRPTGFSALTGWWRP